MEMKRAILFWFYTDVAICRNRLQLLRRTNPDTRIYGLYGGDPAGADRFRAELEEWLDDFYCFPEARSPEWKWVNGDLLISDWYRERGVELAWDAVVVVQWDMLVFDSIDALFAGAQKNEIVVSGVRPVPEVESFWVWTRRDLPERRRELERFRQHLTEHYGYDGPLLACHFVVACLPRSFLKRYAEMQQPELGMVEYRLPTYARVFAMEFRRIESLETWWFNDPNTEPPPRTDRVLLPTGHVMSVPLRIIRHNLRRAAGARVFHPFGYIYPTNRREVLACFLGFRRLRHLCRWLLTAPADMASRLRLRLRRRRLSCARRGKTTNEC